MPHGLIAKLGFRLGFSASARDGSAAHDEPITAAELVVTLAEDILGYCIDAQGFMPALQQDRLTPVVAVIAASWGPRPCNRSVPRCPRQSRVHR